MRINSQSNKLKFLEDEGAGRVMPSAGVTYLAYYTVGVRPTLSDAEAAKLLNKLQRLRSDPPAVFYLELWVNALTGLAKACANKLPLHHQLLWKHFVLVKVPRLILLLETNKKDLELEVEMKMEVENGEKISTAAVETALSQLRGFRRLLNTCDMMALSTSSSLEDMLDDSKSQDIFVSILRVCRFHQLIRDEFIAEIGMADRFGGIELFEEETTNNLLQQAKTDPSIETFETIVSTFPGNFLKTDALIESLLELMLNWAREKNAQNLGTACKQLIERTEVLDGIFLLKSPMELLQPLEEFCNKWSPSSEDDIDIYQANFEGYGYVFTLVAYVINRYELWNNLEAMFNDKSGFCYRWFLRPIEDISSKTIKAEQNELVGQWISALLDSMGIPDDLIRASTPQILLQISPSIFEHALSACETEVIDYDTLTGGLEYFLQPFLSYALLSIIQWLCDEIIFDCNGPSLPLTVLKSLLMSENFPTMVLQVVGRRILAALHLLREEDAEIRDLEQKIISKLEGEEFYVKRWSNEEISYRCQVMYHGFVRGSRSQDEVDQTGSPHIDIYLLRQQLALGGPRWFINMIIGEILNAGGHLGAAFRGAELGAVVISLPIIFAENPHVWPERMLNMMVTEILPEILLTSNGEMNFLLGQALACFIALCLELVLEDKRAELERMVTLILEMLKEAARETVDGTLVDSVSGKEGFLRGFAFSFSENEVLGERIPQHKNNCRSIFGE
ncbi:uncharacterized protein VTP21DRAFT_10936 [Calcarisporiella thermophila]|uniref:uncharacterized protein n=1 Tax=Calcarisporiella thermophila TaxID=911321 RepID=UPI0037433FF7